MFEYRAFCTRVIDGDTVEVTIDLGFKIFHGHSVRLAGLDTPERGQPGYDEAKSFVSGCISGKSIILRSIKDDKYGRYLAQIEYIDVNSNKINLNDKLLSLGLAKPYDGGKKQP